MIIIFPLLHHCQHYLLLLVQDHLYLPNLLFNHHRQFLIRFHHHRELINCFGNLHIPAQFSSADFGNRDQGLSRNLFGSQTQTLAREREKEKVVQDSVKKELDNAIYEVPDQPKFQLVDGLLNSLGVEADDMLEQKFVNKKQQGDAVLEQIKED